MKAWDILEVVYLLNFPFNNGTPQWNRLEMRKWLTMERLETTTVKWKRCELANFTPAQYQACSLINSPQRTLKELELTCFSMSGSKTREIYFRVYDCPKWIELDGPLGWITQASWITGITYCWQITTWPHRYRSFEFRLLCARDRRISYWFAIPKCIISSGILQSYDNTIRFLPLFGVRGISQTGIR